MNFTHNLRSAGAACLVRALAGFFPVPNSATTRTTPPENNMQAAVPDTISGTVVDNATNFPVSGASVALEQLEISGVLMPANQPVTGALVSVEQLPGVVAVPGQAGTTSLIDRVVATTTSGAGRFLDLHRPAARKFL